MVSPEALDWFETNLTGRSPDPTPSEPIPADVRIEDVEIAGGRYRWCIPAAAEAETVISVDAPWPAAVLLLAHTGSAVGSDPTRWAAALASRSGVRVLVTDGVDTTGDDAGSSLITTVATVYDWLVSDGGFLGQHLALVAEGACAAIALTLLDQLATDRRIPQGPALVVLLSPWIDPNVTDPLGRDRGARAGPAEPTDLRLGGDLVHTVDTLRQQAGSALPPGSDTTGWQTRAAGAATVLVGGSEILIGDALAVTRAFAADDVPVTLRVWPYQQHGFHRPIGRFPEADAVTDEIAAAVRAAVRE